MMTGASPLGHGILDFTRLNPATGAAEPITRRAARSGHLEHRGGRERCRVRDVGHVAGRAGEGASWSSDRFFSFTSRESQPPPGIVHPPEREAWARETLQRIEEQRPAREH